MRFCAHILTLLPFFSKEREATKPKVQEVVAVEEEITHDENEWGS